ncbi:hypothetical protein R3P38DRAFT_1880757 [Favolaschia claudopus]|uniref:ABM domain-containing protein n=1 Tax=Favolaschia claudopus TaxID=2862362 RepID=A0AAW0DBT3_9AGAR
MPIVQISSAPASDLLISSPETFQTVPASLKNAAGYKGGYYGLGLEDGKVAHWVAIWESDEFRQKFGADPASAEAIEQLKKGIAGPPTRIGFNSSTDPTAALTSPAVEIATFTAKGGESDKLLSLVGELAKGLEASAGIHKPIVYGPTVEDANKVVLLAGWDSAEAHQAVVKGGSLSGVFGQITAIADFTVGHSALKATA